MEANPLVFVATISVAQEGGVPDGARDDVRGGETGGKREEIAHERRGVDTSRAEELPERRGCPHRDDQDY